MGYKNKQYPQPPDLDDDFQPTKPLDLNEQPPDLDEDFKPTIAKPNFPHSIGPTPPEEPSFGERVWKGISDPLWEGPSRAGKAASQAITEPSLATSPTGDNSWGDTAKIWGNRLSGFGAGALEGIGDMASSLTSPISLGAAALTGGSSLAAKSGYVGGARALGMAARAVSAPVAAHGAKTIYDNPDDPMAWLQGGTEVAGGLAGTLQHIPTAEHPRVPYRGTTITDEPVPFGARDVTPNQRRIGESMKQLTSGNVDDVVGHGSPEPTPFTPNEPPVTTRNVGDTPIDPVGTVRHNPITIEELFPEDVVQSFTPEQRAQVQQQIDTMRPEEARMPQADRKFGRDVMYAEKPNPQFEAEFNRMWDEGQPTSEALAVRENMEHPASRGVLEGEVLPAETILDDFGYPKDRDLTPAEVAEIKKAFLLTEGAHYGTDTEEFNQNMDEATGTIPGEISRPQLPPASSGFAESVTGQTAPQPIMNPDSAQAVLAPEQLDFDVDEVHKSEERGPGYRNQVLSSAGQGLPGLNVEMKPDPVNPGAMRTHIVVRGDDGQPIANAILQRNEEGKLAISNIAAAQGTGLGMKQGRAVKAILAKAQEMDAARPFSGISPDAEKMIRRFTGQKFAEQVAPSTNPLEPTNDYFDAEFGPKVELNQRTGDDIDFMPSNAAEVVDMGDFKERKLTSVTDHAIALDNYNNLDEELQSLKIHGGSPDEIEQIGYLRDVALDHYRQLTSGKTESNYWPSEMAKKTQIPRNQNYPYADPNNPTQSEIDNVLGNPGFSDNNPIGSEPMTESFPESPTPEGGDEFIRMELGDRETILRNQLGQYAEHGGRVATKELLQNAIDATRYLPGTSAPGQAGQPNPDGIIHVYFDNTSKDPAGKYTITISDNGPGLPLALIKNEYVTLTGSGKRGQGQFSGEMGVGKTTYLLGSKKFIVGTVTREPDGNIWGHEFSGTPEEMITGRIRVKSEKLDPSTPTGTTVVIYENKEKSMAAAMKFMQQFGEYSDSPVTVKVSGKDFFGGDINDIVHPRNRSQGKHVSTGEVLGAKYSISVPDDANWGEHSGIAGILNNRGMFQGVDNLYVGGNGGVVPDRVIIDIEPTVPATDAENYPLTSPTRERMKAELKQAVQDSVNKDIAEAARAKRQNEIQQVFDNLKPALGNKHVIHDSGNRYTPEELNNLEMNPRMNHIAEVMRYTIEQLDSLFPVTKKYYGVDVGEQLGKTVKFGFLIGDPDKGGINIPNPASKAGKREYAILMNPFGAILNSKTPKDAAQRMLHIILHEFNHNMARSEGGNFTWQLAQLYERFDLDKQIYARDHILKALIGTDGDYTPEISQLLLEYTEARGRKDTSLDLLSRARDNEFIGAGRAISYAEDTRPTGGGTSTESIFVRPSPRVVRDTLAKGYKYTGEVNEKGEWKFIRQGGERNVDQPILGEDVGGNRPTKSQAKLQEDLRGAQPRFNIGGDSYIPKFESDIDKALFIIAQKTASKRDHDFLKFVMTQTGMNNVQARMAGQQIRVMIKNIAQGKPAGEINIPILNTKLNKEAFGGGRNPPPPPPSNRPSSAPPPFDRNNAIDRVGTGGNGGGRTPPPNRPTNAPPPSGDGMNVDTDVHIGTPQNVRKASPWLEAYNLSRGLAAAWDFSAPLRQGLGLVHKKAFREAIPAMFKAWGSEEGFKAIQDNISQRELFRPRPRPGGKMGPSFAEDAGLKLGDLLDFRKREEQIMSTWAETGGSIPYFSKAYRNTYGRGVRASNRAYTAFLNKLRADTFEDLMKSAKVFGVNGEANMPVARAMAEFVNNATGRGSLKGLEQSAHILNGALFSPRLMASRLQMMNPANYIMGPPAVRKEYLKSLFAIAAFGNTVLQLGKMAGFKVGTDPNSADFGKLIIGNTRLDPWGGFQQYIVAANRLIRPASVKVPNNINSGIAPVDLAAGFAKTGGQSVHSSTTSNKYDLWNPKPGPYDPTHGSVLERFAWGKTHPVVNFALAILNGRKELSGEKMNFATMNPMENAIAQRFIPIIWQDLYELSQENPKLLPVVGPPAMFGMGTQTYD